MNRNEVLSQMREINAKMATASDEEIATLQGEFNAKKRELELMDAQANAPVVKVNSAEQLREIAKEAVRTGQQREISLSILTETYTNNIVSSGAVPLNIQDLLPILEKGLIWDKVGLRVQTGVKGDLLWPYATTAVECEEVGEAAALNDKDINFANKKAVPYGSGITIKVTNEAIDNADFDLLGFVQTQMSLAVQRYLNKKTFSPANWSGLAGPYKNYCGAGSASNLDATWANIKAKKALIAATGADMSAFAYVMDNKTRALLETTPKAAGQAGMIMEGGKIDGDPVYVTEYINTKGDGTQETEKYYLELGCFNYLAANQHGQLRFIIDPYTLAAYGEVRFILRTNWSLTNLATAAAFSIFNLVPATPASVNVAITNTAASPVNIAGSVTVDNTEASPVNTKEVSAGE